MLYTSPMYAEHIVVGEEGRPAGGARISILMPPGQYTVRLNVDGATHEQPLTVIKDPHSAGTEADIAEQIAFLRDVRVDVVAAGEAVHRVEALRVQLQTMARFAEDEALSDAIAELEDKLEELQGTLVDLRLTGQGQDVVRFAARLLSKLGYLTNALSNADFPPTNQEMEVKGILHEQLQAHLAAVEQVIAEDVAALNEMLRSRGLLLITDGG